MVSVRPDSRVDQQKTKGPPEPIASVGVELENIVPRDVGRVTDITLPRPVAFDPAEESRAMIVEREELSLVQGRLLPVICL